MGNFDEYNANVGRKQGGDKFFIKSGGSLDMESGGEINVESGGSLDIEGGGALTVAESGVFTFYGQDFVGSVLKLILLSQKTITNYISAGSVLSLSQMTPGYGYALFSLAAGCSLASTTLPVPLSGAMLFLNFSGLVSNAIVSVLTSGFSVVGLHGSDLSSFEVSHGGLLRLVCVNDGAWAVTQKTDSVTENASA